MLCGCSSKEWIFTMEQGEKPVNNPYKGFVAWGENYREDDNVAFAYVPVYWSELEKEEGVYDFEALENRNYFEEWTKNDVYLILRVVMDSPSDKEHADIPEWLLEKVNGTYYDTEYGKGFSPDYADETLIAYHEKLIQALASRYRDDERIAFIQLGSLGHWGEWHIHSDIGEFVKSEISDRYVQHYIDNFDSSMLMMRRPFDIAQENHMGLYNDSFGKPSSHERWLDWIENGYTSDQSNEFLNGMSDFWKYAPSGGEFATYQDVMWYFENENFEQTMDFLRRSHTSFLGPNAPKNSNDENVLELLKELGYCFAIEEVKVTKGFGSYDIKLKMNNIGIAPIYKNLDLIIWITDENDSPVYGGIIDDVETALKMNEFVIDGSFAFEKTDSTKYKLWVGLKDAIGPNSGIELANSEPTFENTNYYFVGVIE